MAVLLLISARPVRAQLPFQQSPGGAGTIRQGETKTHQVQIDQADTTMFTLFYGSGNLNLALVSPQGQVFDSTSAAADTNAMWSEGPFPFGGIWENLVVRHPRSGTWTIRVTAPLVDNPSGSSMYVVGLNHMTRIKLKASTQMPDTITGEPLLIKARLTNSEEPILDASVLATVVAPNESTTVLTCVDDGSGPDSARADGIYTAQLKGTRTSIPGWYEVQVKAKGHVAGESGFEREDLTEALIPKSHDIEDFDDVWEKRQYGPDEPPLEIRVDLEHDSRSGTYTYAYAISNGSPYPVRSFEIGIRGHSSYGLLRSEPLGWEDHPGVPSTSYSAPEGWWLSFRKNRKGLGDLSWMSRDSSAWLAPGQSLKGFRVKVPRPDTTFQRSNWSVLPSRSHNLYYGALVSTKDPPPAGDSMDRLGKLTVVMTKKREATISFKTPKGVRLGVAIVDGYSNLIQDLSGAAGDGVEHRVVWDGRNAGHQEVPAGEYFVLVAYGNTERYGRLRLDP